MGVVKRTPNRGLQGFTLVELLTTVLVVAVLLVMVAPSMSALIKRNSLVALHGSLRASLSVARTQAVETGQAVSVCPMGRNGGCAFPSGDWSRGWMVFEDPDHTGRCDNPAKTGFCHGTRNRVLEIRSPVKPGYVIRSNHHVSRRVRFAATGMSYGHNGRFTLCALSGQVKPVGLVVAATGRVRRARGSDLLPCP
jgi:prepilin-type N-terminal cleavage/methylation domain-containing protein